MAKRKEFEDDPTKAEESSSEESASEESGDDEDTNMVDVDFEWFDPQAEHDFHGIKTLLRQLFDADANLVNLSDLTNLILAQPLLGSTVKVDGNESDPYAFLSVLNMKEHEKTPAVQALSTYLSDRAKKSSASNELLSALQSTSNTVGVLLTERLINVPSEVVPPMYKMLVEEITWALEEKEPYQFSHYLILSKTYQEVESALDNEDESTRHHKKQKKASRQGDAQTFYLHPEDEILHQHALAFTDFEYATTPDQGQPDSKRAFQELGIKPNGHMILLEASKFEGAVHALQQAFQQGS